MEDFYYQNMADIQKTHWWYEGRRVILSSLIEKLSLPEKAQILEVGCGTGANLEMLQKFGTVSGIEPHSFARDYAQNMSGCDIQDGHLPDALPFKKTFDLIGAFDVIEHVEEDFESLQTIRDKLSDKGHAVFTIPAFQCLWSKHDDINHHKRRYTRQEFLFLLTEAGYDVTFISYYNTYLFPIATLILSLKKLMPKKDSGNVKMPKFVFINTILRALFSSERFFLTKNISVPLGLSIIAVCRKK